MAESITSARRVLAAERRERAVEMRKDGARLADIARDLGITEAAVHKTIKKALSDALAKANLDAAELRELEAQRLDTRELRINTAIQKAMADRDYALVARLDGQLASISAARRKLFGLDEPEKHDVTSGGAPLVRFVVTTDESDGDH